MSEDEARKNWKVKTLILKYIFHYKLVEEIKGSTNLERSLKDPITCKERQRTTWKLSGSEKMENISAFDHSVAVRAVMMSLDIWNCMDPNRKGEWIIKLWLFEAS